MIDLERSVSRSSLIGSSRTYPESSLDVACYTSQHCWANRQSVKYLINLQHRIRGTDDHRTRFRYGGLSHSCSFAHQCGSKGEPMLLHEGKIGLRTLRRIPQVSMNESVD